MTQKHQAKPVKSITPILNNDDPNDCETIEELARFILDCNYEAQELEEKLLTLKK